MNFLKVNGNQISIKEFEDSQGLKVYSAESFSDRSDIIKTPAGLDLIDLIKGDFSDCDKLNEIKDGLKAGLVSFKNCRSLVKIGKNVEVNCVDFDNCSELKEIPEDFKCSLISLTGTKVNFLSLKYAEPNELSILCDGKVFHSITDFNVFKNSKRVLNNLKGG